MDERYVEALKAIADPNRLRLFWLLVQIDERICVAEAMDVLGQTHYNISRNLKILQRAGLVTVQKEGKWVFYTLISERLLVHAKLLETVQSIPAQEFADEIKKCRLRLSLRQNNECVLGPDSQEWSLISAKGE